MTNALAYRPGVTTGQKLPHASLSGCNQPHETYNLITVIVWGLRWKIISRSYCYDASCLFYILHYAFSCEKFCCRWNKACWIVIGILCDVCTCFCVFLKIITTSLFCLVIRVLLKCVCNQLPGKSCLPNVSSRRWTLLICLGIKLVLLLLEPSVIFLITVNFWRNDFK